MADCLTNRERFLLACRCQPVDHPPVWLMRQAGRVLPEYRALKEKHSFVEMVRTPELATEVTLQPIRRFGFDAAILFSDILVIAEALGQSYHFRETGGIQMAFALRSEADLDRLDGQSVPERLDYVAQALRLIKQTLAGQTALIGFAGSPWTVANFMLEGGSSPDFSRSRELLRDQPRVYAKLAEKLTHATAAYLKLQIENGAEVVQIFDTLGGLLAPGQFEEASARWMRDIISELQGRVPVIVFSKGVNYCWDTLRQTGANVLGVDWTIPLSVVRAALPDHIAVQGNLDPAVLIQAPEVVQTEVRRILTDMRGRPGHIFNLGHGVPPEARLESIAALVETIRGKPLAVGGGEGAKQP